MYKEEVGKTYLAYIGKIGDRRALYRTVIQKYDIKHILYPGSHIDITPSLIHPKVVYVDNFKGTIKFFKAMDSIREYIFRHKECEADCDIVFMGQDYRQELKIEPVDLIISQYAGFVGQATKKYLKPGGILLCNDSHGDATLAQFDEAFELVGVLNEEHRIIDDHLDQYFVMPKNKPVDLIKVAEKMQGPKYKQTAENYLFRKR